MLTRADIAPTVALSSDGYPRRAAEGGRGFSYRDTQVAGVFEGLERYSMSVFHRDLLPYGSHASLTAAGKTALRPADLGCQLTHTTALGDILDTMDMRWVEGLSLVSGRPVLVPAQLVYVPYHVQGPEVYLRDPLTTGGAAGLSWAGAVRRGIMEVVERDALMMMHYRDITPDLLDASTLPGDQLRELLDEAERYRLTVRLFRIPTDVPVHAVVAQVTDDSGVGPEFTLGSKASGSLAESAVGALFEAVCFRRGLRERLAHAREFTEHNLAEPSDIICLEDRTYYWCRRGAALELDYLNRAPAEAAQDWSTADYDLTDTLDHLTQQMGEIVVVDVTTPDVAELGVSVIKAVIPELQPMHLSEAHRCFTRRIVEGTGAGHFDVARADRLPHPYL